MSDVLAGFRVLVVEDEMLIALEVEEGLGALGCEIVGPIATLDEALALAASERLDAAILDVTIRGGQVFPVADRLLERGIPFVLASGYGDWSLPERFRDQPRLTKPFSAAQLEAQVRLLSAQASSRA